MDFKKILWPTDLSGSAKLSLHYVQSLTEKYQPEIHVMYVIEDLAHHQGWYGDFERRHIEKITEWEHKKAKERLDDICSNYLAGCPLYIKHFAIGDPAKEILNLVEKEKIDMVIMSTRGTKGNYSFSSVTGKVVKNSPVPVVSVPIHGDPITLN